MYRVPRGGMHGECEFGAHANERELDELLEECRLRESTRCGDRGKLSLKFLVDPGGEVRAAICHAGHLIQSAEKRPSIPRLKREVFLALSRYSCAFLQWVRFATSNRCVTP